MNKKVISILSGLLCVSVVQADEDEYSQPLVVGLAAMYKTGVYKDLKEEVTPIPLVWGEYKRFWFRGPDVGVAVIKNDVLSLSPFVSFNLGGGYDQSSVEDGSNLYDGLPDTDGSIEGGLELELEVGVLELGISYRSDISDTHKGDLAEISLENNFVLFGDKLILMPEISVQWASEKYNQYYYGVLPEFANANRSEYKPGSDTSYEVSTRGMYRAGPVRLLGVISWSLYSDAITESPLVENDSEVFVAFGVGYEF